MKTAPRTPNEALQSCADQSANGPTFPYGTCQMQAHLRYLVPSDGTPDAATAFHNAVYKFRTDDPTTAPRGAFHYWIGGSSGHGHVSLQRFLRHDATWSTDIKRTGYYDSVGVPDIHNSWGLTYVGWSLDNDGVLCVPEAVDYLQGLLHPSLPPLPKPDPATIPLDRKVRVIHNAARRARKAGHVKWAARLGAWAEQLQARLDKQTHKGSTVQEHASK